MTDDTPYDGPDLTAAELALGLLEGEERAAALRRVIAEPAFAREVEAWRQRLSGLFEDYADVPAPETVAQRLAAPDKQPAKRRAWPIVAALSALAATLALFFVMRPVPEPVRASPQLMVASLILTDKSAALPVVVELQSGDMHVTGASPAPKGKSGELWLIGSDGVPKALGVLAASGNSRMTLPADMRARMTDGVTLAISIEPVGGSPTGQPTGPVVASGKLSAT